jgi:uncharacterized protein YabN with tetrapyrrole methylase and pyrophosphatase domain
MDVFNAITEMAKAKTPIAWLTPGHPVIFDSVSASLLSDARVRGWNVRVIPAISSIDTLLAELGYDPAHGLLIHEATGLVKRRIPVDPSVAMMLLQPAVYDVNTAIISNEHPGPDLSPLRDYLLTFFPAEHKCALIRSSSAGGESDVVTWLNLVELVSVPYRLLAGATLFIPPV